MKEFYPYEQLLINNVKAYNVLVEEAIDIANFIHFDLKLDWCRNGQLSKYPRNHFRAFLLDFECRFSINRKGESYSLRCETTYQVSDDHEHHISFEWDNHKVVTLEKLKKHIAKAETIQDQINKLLESLEANREGLRSFIELTEVWGVKS